MCIPNVVKVALEFQIIFKKKGGGEGKGKKMFKKIT